MWQKLSLSLILCLSLACPKNHDNQVAPEPQAQPQPQPKENPEVQRKIQTQIYHFEERIAGSSIGADFRAIRAEIRSSTLPEEEKKHLLRDVDHRWEDKIIGPLNEFEPDLSSYGAVACTTQEAHDWFKLFRNAINNLKGFGREPADLEIHFKHSITRYVGCEENDRLRQLVKDTVLAE